MVNPHLVKISECQCSLCLSWVDDSRSCFVDGDQKNNKFPASQREFNIFMSTSWRRPALRFGVFCIILLLYLTLDHTIQDIKAQHIISLALVRSLFCDIWPWTRGSCFRYWTLSHHDHDHNHTKFCINLYTTLIDTNIWTKQEWCTL